MARLSAHQPQSKLKLKLKPNKMPEAVETRGAIAPFKRWLSVWIASSMAAGLTLGWAYPRGAEAIGSLSVAEVNPVAAVLVWLLIVPSMVGMSRGLSSWVSLHAPGRCSCGHN